MYWSISPKSKRRLCVFRKSCSAYVFEKTLQTGFLAGIKAFVFRFGNCRNGCAVFVNPIDGRLQMILPNNELLDEEFIARHVITFYRETNSNKRKDRV